MLSLEVYNPGPLRIPSWIFAYRLVGPPGSGSASPLAGGGGGSAVIRFSSLFFPSPSVNPRWN
jgi:hypothetical protein